MWKSSLSSAVNWFYHTGYWRGRPKVHSTMSKGFLTWQTCFTLLRFEQIVCVCGNILPRMPMSDCCNACKTLTFEEGTIWDMVKVGILMKHFQTSNNLSNQNPHQPPPRTLCNKYVIRFWSCIWRHWLGICLQESLLSTAPTAIDSWHWFRLQPVDSPSFLLTLRMKPRISSGQKIMSSYTCGFLLILLWNHAIVQSWV